MKIIKKIKWSIQRMKRGFSDADVWSFDYHLAKMISEGMNAMISRVTSPPDGMTMEQWINTLRRIRYGFDFYVYCEEEEVSQEQIDKSKTAVKESLELLGEHFGKVWY